MPATIPREFVTDTFIFNFSACKTRLSAPLAILQGTDQSVICMVFQNSVCLLVTKLSKQQAEVIQNHHNPNVCNIRQGKAQHRTYMRLKLGSSQAYNHSTVLQSVQLSNFISSDL
jgi:hypothetical protein